MVDDLYALFQGSRYQRSPGQVRLRRDGRIITDIDAAVFDELTGNLVLFQLKWQDFSGSDVRSQKSKAKNFVDQVRAWGQATNDWIGENGTASLCRNLKFRLNGRSSPVNIRLVAIGRSNARFESYGYEANSVPTTLSWPQFARLRLQTGPGTDFLGNLQHLIEGDHRAASRRQPLPYELTVNGTTMTFSDIWSGFPDPDPHA